MRFCIQEHVLDKIKNLIFVAMTVTSQTSILSCYPQEQDDIDFFYHSSNNIHFNYCVVVISDLTVELSDILISVLRFILIGLSSALDGEIMCHHFLYNFQC